MTFEDLIRTTPNPGDRLGLFAIFELAQKAPREHLEQIESKYGTFGREQFARLMNEYVTYRSIYKMGA